MRETEFLSDLKVNEKQYNNLIFITHFLNLYNKNYNYQKFLNIQTVRAAKSLNYFNC